MKRLLLSSVFVFAAMACSRSGKPLVVETAAGLGKEYVDPHYFREMPLGFKVIWFIGPGHCPFVRSATMVVGIDVVEIEDAETAEMLQYRSPIYYLWLYPIKRAVGADEPRPPTTSPERSSLQPSGPAPVRLPPTGPVLPPA